MAGGWSGMVAELLSLISLSVLIYRLPSPVGVYISLICQPAMGLLKLPDPLCTYICIGTSYVPSVAAYHVVSYATGWLS